MAGKRHFALTEQHIALLKHAYVGWDNCEFGAPAIDCKRPYGNSDVYGDIAEILGIKPDPSGREDGFTDEQEAEMDRLHNETETALQIILRTLNIEPGLYEADNYTENWKLAAD